ncbi:hypothetical protein A8924_3452 [Saccharopolyspora erythraea NRRL 2338]|uniref:Uncharacterized protein n=2 Tax=Saccharopolyspora erythraea TaxID=1836 RepID=A4FE61_SACEN|nr:hypothetical protein [Saccharopolyspora erythraea]EQD85166.1 hypothetical protein N599_16100 [Saccharopolyspora erythraea D]PFG96064.1 hypothetical protein A8924_3452 [Saccharopolyspora erythraea NRRL 2338]QRK92610.1 hypothetical protein JQX30_15710 [Saccharopolyspora erythraea]CAM02336.1 hypothetical protein SACE_3058 [Saccharopolyspora erythraea NRRL 2338]
MGLDNARAVADAVLFEGYLLYPYRASALKNRMRWQFGVLAPNSGGAGEPSHARTECLVEPGAEPVFDIRVRFLHLRRHATTPSWDEGVVREIPVAASIRDEGTHEFPWEIGEDGEAGRDERTCRLNGVVRLEVRGVEDASELRKVAVTVENRTPWTPRPGDGRDEMLRRAMVSAHTMLAVQDGGFLSLLDPPQRARAAAKSCRNEHTWPVLVGEPGSNDVVLSAPIILYDHPAVSAQSPGDLFDATEIDEILTLRTMTLTDAEKQEVRETDPRAAELIERTEGLPPEILERLHGTVRFPQREGR